MKKKATSKGSLGFCFVCKKFQFTRKMRAGGYQCKVCGAIHNISVDVATGDTNINISVKYCEVIKKCG